MELTRLDKNEKAVYDYLHHLAGFDKSSDEAALLGEEESEEKPRSNSFFAKLVLLADPDGKTLLPQNRQATEAIRVDNERNEEIFYLPLKRLGLTKRFTFAIDAIVRRLEDANDFYSKVKISQLYPSNSNSKITFTSSEGNLETINLPVITSLITEAKHELRSIPIIIDTIYGILASKAGTINYNTAQLTLFKAQKLFLAGIIPALENIIDKIDYSSKDLVYSRLTTFVGASKTFTEGKLGRRTIYPEDYERAVKLLAGIINKWLVTDTSRISPSAENERSNRLARLARAGSTPDSALSNLRKTLNIGATIENDSLAAEVIKKLTPTYLPDDTLPMSYEQVSQLFLSFGGDSNMLPALTRNITVQLAHEALNYIRGQGFVNSRFMFAAFKLLGVDDSVTESQGGIFASRKTLPFDLEVALYNTKDNNGNSVLLSINKAAPIFMGMIDQSTGLYVEKSSPSLIVSDNLYNRFSTSDIAFAEAFAQRHTAGKSGYVQKGTLSISSLIQEGSGKSEMVEYNLNGSFTSDGQIFSSIKEAINIISFAAILYKYQTQPSIDKVVSKIKKSKKISENAAKEQNRNALVQNQVMFNQLPVQNGAQSPSILLGNYPTHGHGGHPHNAVHLTDTLSHHPSVSHHVGHIDHNPNRQTAFHESDSHTYGRISNQGSGVNTQVTGGHGSF